MKPKIKTKNEKKKTKKRNHKKHTTNGSWIWKRKNRFRENIHELKPIMLKQRAKNKIK